MTKEELFDKYAELCCIEEGPSEFLLDKEDFIEATKNLYLKEEVFKLMCIAFEAGFKKAEVVEAGLEGLETDVECAWILNSQNK